MHPAPAAASRVPTRAASARRQPPADPAGDLAREQRDRLHRFVARHVGNRSEADDITQQALAEMWLSYDRFRGDSKPSTWLYGIALNLIRNYLSRSPERRYAFVDIDTLAAEASAEPDPPARAEWRQMLGIVDRAMNEIPPDLRELLHLVAVEELSYEEAAQRLALPIGTVRSRLSRARAQLRIRMRARGVSLDS
ncbi:RNA polymerase sigma factor [Achromobacter sp. NPDC058515]|uniref:RNA polymerase sigma factor n=1 Tax=Achromobacter sp. NPDC058515 TaxID=3346533 RepID=UPI00365D153B